MSNTAVKVSELPTAANIASTDRVMILRDPTGVPSVRTINTNIFWANLIISNTVPANSSSSGIPGTIRFDSNYIYICTANNTWKRATISTW